MYGLARALAGIAALAAAAAGGAGDATAAEPAYTEDLKLTPLPHNMLLSEFSFAMQQAVDTRDPTGTQYSAFPRSLGQILERAGTHELHLRFGQGWWDAESWGAEPARGSVSGGIGVEMWAWVRGASLDDARANWHRLAHALSGYFCASLNFVDLQRTSLPSEAVHVPSGELAADELWLLRGALPGEPVCTENLTPFLKLLPCKANAGVASLLDGHSLFDSQWQSMAIDVDRVGETLRLRQHILNVVDVPRMLQRRKSPLPTPIPYEDLQCVTEKAWVNDWACLPVEPTNATWRLSEIYGQQLQGACPLAAGRTRISVEAPENWTTELLDTAAAAAAGDEPAAVATVAGAGALPLDRTGPLDVELRSANSTQVAARAAPPVFVDRSFTGYGQQRGGMRTEFTNTGAEPIRLAYFESLPWFMRVYLHTLRVEPAAAHSVADLAYTGAQDRGRPSQLELVLTVPPHSTVTVEYDFDKSLLFLDEYPPDANHGFEIPPGLAVTDSGYTTRTTSLLLYLPVPDFSMPYNVIILTSTVMSLCFGNLFNLLAKTTVPEALGERVGGQKGLGKLLALLRPQKQKQE